MDPRRVGRWLRTSGVACLLAAVLACAVPVAASDVPAAASDDVPSAPALLDPVDGAPGEPAEGGDGRRTLGRLPANLGWGIIGVFHGDSVAPLFVGAMATGGATLYDHGLRDAVANPESGFGKGLEAAGGWPSSVLVVGLFTAGRFAHGSRFRAMSYDLLDATIVNIGYTALLKVAVRRERPDASNNKSFPSGHASHAFTLATVAELHYGWKVGLPAYTLAAVVGYSRIVRDRHFLSDVVAGAAVGYIVGRTVVRVNGRPLANGSRPSVSVDVAPILGRDARGLQVTVLF